MTGFDGRVTTADPPDPAATVRWLAGPVGRAVARDAVEIAASTSATAAPGVLRRRHPDLDAGLVTAALGQVDLRARGRTRFGPDAAAMVFTRDGLEQATRRTVADHRAAQLRVRSAGTVRTVGDLCCGIGGDLVALARAGFTVTGVDLAPVAVAAARANAAALGLSAAVEIGDVTGVDPGRFDAVVADPARRSGRGRESDPAAFSPAWDWVRALLTRPGIRAGVTTTPALAHRLVPAGCEAEWVGEAGETVEAALWSPALGTGVRRRATLLSPGGTVSVTDAELPDRLPPVRDPRAGDVLVDPVGPVVRAGLVGVLAARLDGALVAPGIAYVLAGPAPSPATVPEAPGGLRELEGLGGLGVAFEVLEVLPVRDRVLRSRLAQLDVGSLEILKRGVEVRPEALRPRLIGTRPTGSAAATVVFTRTAAGGAALLVRRLADG